MTASEYIPAEKVALRRLARAARCALDAETCRTAAVDAAERLLALPQIAAAEMVLAYSATTEELDPAPAVESLRAHGKTIVLPRVHDATTLTLHAVAEGDELVAGSLGILEPRADAPLVEPAAIDAAIVPGVAFDSAGRRLGYGGGYYDRLVPALRADCVLIGYAYDEQVLDEIPSAEHDAHVDVVVTPTRALVR